MPFRGVLSLFKVGLVLGKGVGLPLRGGRDRGDSDGSLF